MPASTIPSSLRPLAGVARAETSFTPDDAERFPAAAALYGDVPSRTRVNHDLLVLSAGGRRLELDAHPAVAFFFAAERRADTWANAIPVLPPRANRASVRFRRGSYAEHCFERSRHTKRAQVP